MNTLAICLGGTLNTMALAYLEAVGDHLVNSTTLLNSATDYGTPGCSPTCSPIPAPSR